MPPAQVYRSLLGHNPGLHRARAVVEARVSFVGKEVSLPGVLLLDVLEGFRLDLLDPLDRPLAIIHSEAGRIVQYRPGQRTVASLGVFPEDCRGIDPAEWVQAITASSYAPAAEEHLEDRGIWRNERVLERLRSGQLRQSLLYRIEGSRLVPRVVSWYCEEEVVMRLRLSDWIAGADWQLPTRIGIDYLKSNLSVTLELRELESNPPSTDQPFRPRLDPDVRSTSWNLPR